MQLDPQRGYDLIGDVHGCAHSLERLLDALGYRLHAGMWRHPCRMALFLGDIIDRGPRIREALHLVHSMVDAGQAACLMGNHEFNALGWETPVQGSGGQRYVREHTALHARQLQQTHEQFAAYGDEWREFTEWFQQLPLFIDAQRFRLVHACWDAPMIAQLKLEYPQGCIDQTFMQAAAEPGSFAHQVFNRLLRGTDMRLPDGLTLTGDDGYTRAHFRTKFWADAPQTYGDVVFQPDALPEHVAQTLLSAEQKSRLLQYPLDQPLLFVGHYWRRGVPAPIQSNLACLDYSAVLRGKLVAYRLDQERQLDAGKFCWVAVERPEAPK
ncbi:MAG: diadenosine tetraphosphatase ApaH/serine/threonine PP2A family protein phosphatase [Pseudomonas sp.]|jgi:diadenosine tetraphosphatase ApaH/serine/threonine PP2A family protein phosphatase